MLTAIISLSALLVIVVLSCFVPRLNPGFLALLASLTIGLGLAGMSTKTVLLGFPVELFVLLVAMTTVFGIAQQNGTLDVVTQHAINLIKGQSLLLLLLVFFGLRDILRWFFPPNHYCFEAKK